VELSPLIKRSIELVIPISTHEPSLTKGGLEITVAQYVMGMLRRVVVSTNYARYLGMNFNGDKRMKVPS